MASRFTGELRLASLDADCIEWRLEADFSYEVGSLSSGKIIIVKQGFITDGASIPRFIQWALPAWAKWSRAAIIHDKLCRDLNETGSFAIPNWGISKRRKDADDIFLEAMRVSGVSRFVATLLWLGVRAADKFPLLQRFSSR